MSETEKPKRKRSSSFVWVKLGQLNSILKDQAMIQISKKQYDALVKNGMMPE